MDTPVFPNATLASSDRLALERDAVQSNSSGVSWAAIFAGAVGAAILTMILMLLGTGLGLSAMSPWSGEGVSAKSLGIATIVWLIIIQLLAALLGGYLAGRLRTKWVGVHTNEVYFRDTAHGFLAWALASLAVASLLATAATAVVSGGAKAGAMIGGSALGAAGTAALTGGGSASTGAMGERGGNAGGSSESNAYFVDMLFRPAPPAGANAAGANGAEGGNGAAGSNGASGAAGPSMAMGVGGASSAAGNAAQNAEATRVFANAVASGSLPDADATYLGQMVAQRTGMSQQDADKRVNDTFAALEAKIHAAENAAARAADAARKATAYASLWLVVSLLIGAFVASWAAAFAGRLRDSSSLSHA